MSQRLIARRAMSLFVIVTNCGLQNTLGILFYFTFTFCKQPFMRICLVFSFIILVLIACEDNNKNKVPEISPLTTQGNNSDIVNYGVGALINEYYAIKDAFVLENDATIKQHALAMQKGIDTLDLKSVQGTNAEKDKNTQLISEINASLKALLNEKNVDAKRKSFQTISDNLYDLIKSVRFDKQIIYHQHCPMAFNEAGASWLSNNPDIKNPYLPKKMISCGEVLDTLDFTQSKMQ